MCTHSYVPCNLPNAALCAHSPGLSPSLRPQMNLTMWLTRCGTDVSRRARSLLPSLYLVRHRTNALASTHDIISAGAVHFSTTHHSSLLLHYYRRTLDRVPRRSCDRFSLASTHHASAYHLSTWSPSSASRRQSPSAAIFSASLQPLEESSSGTDTESCQALTLATLADTVPSCRYDSGYINGVIAMKYFKQEFGSKCSPCANGRPQAC